MTEREGRRERRWSVKWTIIVCLPILLLLLYFGWRIALKRRVAHELAWYRAQGYPTTLAELDEWYAKPKGDNAADVYQDAFGAYVSPSGKRFDDLPFVGIRDTPPLGKPLPAKVMKVAREYLDRNRAALAHLRRAVTIPECRFPIRLTDGPRVRLPHLVKLRQGARLLAIEGLLFASEGRAREASENLADCLKLGRSLAKEPMMISRLVRLAMDAIALRSIERTLNLVAFGDARLHEMDRLLEAREKDSACTRCLVGEVMFANDWMRRASAKNIVSWSNVGGGSVVFLPLYYVAGWRDVDLAWYLRFCGRTIEHRRRHPPGTGKAPAPVTSVPRHCLMSRGMLPCWESFFAKENRILALCRAARAAVAVQRYRLKRGALPGSLKDLVPEYLRSAPLDPFSGKPLIYRKLKKGFSVHSVGWNGKDDGGRHKPAKGWDDQAFEVVR